MVEIKKSVLDKILEWSTPPYDKNKTLHLKIVAALLLSCVGVDKLAKHEIEDDAKDFVKSKTKLVITEIVFSNSFYFSEIIEIRVKGSASRLLAVEKHFKRVCLEWEREMKD